VRSIAVPEPSPSKFRQSCSGSFRRVSITARKRRRLRHHCRAFDENLGFYKSSGHLAPKSEVEAALGRIGYRHVHLDPAAQTVAFDVPASNSTGGIGKGSRRSHGGDLKQRGAERALWPGRTAVYMAWARLRMNAGMEVGIRDPKNSRRAVAQVFLKNYVALHLRQL